MMKKCSKCNKTINIENFYKDSASADGFSAWCKDCKREYKRTWLKENREHVRRYYHNNKECCLQHQKQWRDSHKEYKKAYDRRYAAENRKKASERQKRWRRRNPEKTHNQRMKYRSLIGDSNLTKEEYNLIFESTDWHCFYCNISLTNSNKTIDHWIPISRGGDHKIYNLLPACRSCNSSKNDKLYREWKKLGV